MWGWREMHRGSLSGSSQFSAGPRAWFLGQKCFQEATRRGSVELEDRPVTWPFEALCPTEQMDKKSSHSAGWGVILVPQGKLGCAVIQPR